MLTLLLEPGSWDLVLDAAGNIAAADLPYAAAQNAASAVKLFKGEYYYDTSKGVPYFEQILGRRPPLALVRAKFIAAAKGVPDVAAARCFFSSFTDHKLSGQLIVTDVNRQTSTAGF
jgi:hypothetical protein